MVTVFLDVDGTLLPFGASPGRRLPSRASSASPLLNRIDLRLGPRLARLPCDLVWATTWMTEANKMISPLLGLPQLPVLDWPEPSVEDEYFRLHPKTRSLVAWASGAALAWVDDEITDMDREWVADNHPGPALLLQVNPHVGLTESNVRSLENWLNNHFE